MAAELGNNTPDDQYTANLLEKLAVKVWWKEQLGLPGTFQAVCESVQIHEIERRQNENALLVHSVVHLEEVADALNNDCAERLCRYEGRLTDLVVRSDFDVSRIARN